MTTDLALLEWLGGMLDFPVKWDDEPETGGEQELTVRDELIQGLLKIRTKAGKPHFTLNRSQAEYSRRCTKRNIVLKARQRAVTCCYTSLESMNMRSRALLESSNGA